MERVMALLLNDFHSRDNVEISLILIGKTRQIDFKIPAGLKVYTPTFTFNDGQRTLSTVKTMRFIRKSIKEIDPDTVLSFGEYWNNMVLLSLMGLQFPVYISDRSQPNKNLGKVQNYLRNILYPKAAGFIAQTEKAKEIAIRNKWNRNITIIGNPIRDVAEYPGMVKENSILTVGRLIPTKNIDALIRIFANCNMPEWSLVIVGGNAKKMNLWEDYRNLVKSLGLEDRVKLVGEQQNVDEYYRRSKIFAFTSSSEGFPNVVGEAISASLPVIAYDCVAGPSDLVEDGINGYLIPLFDEDQFTEKLKILINDEQKRCAMGTNGKQIIANFVPDKIADKFYRFILNK